MKVDFTQGQRMEIINGFLYEFRQCPAYKAIGTYLKSVISESIKLHFMPTDKKFPPLEVTEDENNYKFEITLNLNPIVGGYDLKLIKVFPKMSLASK